MDKVFTMKIITEKRSVYEAPQAEELILQMEERFLESVEERGGEYMPLENRPSF